MFVPTVFYNLLLVVTIYFSTPTLRAQKSNPQIVKNTEGTIVFTKDSLGNQIPDYSYCGYQNSNQSIPTIPIKAVVATIEGDATATIQEALDYVGSLKADQNGYRGSVLLNSGVYHIEGNLIIAKSGVVLRGSGTGDNGTVLLSTGSERMALIQLLGGKNQTSEKIINIEDNYVPLGTRTLNLSKSTALTSNSSIRIVSQFKQHWIDLLQMNNFGGETDWLGWKTSDFKIVADREVIDVDGHKITLDAPLTQPLNNDLSVNYLEIYNTENRIVNSGVENLIIDSEYRRLNPKDEQHRWDGISIDNAIDVWVRQVNFYHLAGSAVIVQQNAKRVTVEDCIAKNPISEVASYRRNTFYTEGQQTLFQRCYAASGFHDFAVGGYGTSGPNVFVQCKSYLPFSYSGSIGSWNTGLLFDNVTIDGDAISFANKGQDTRGLGWNAAYSMIWESSASKIENYAPPLATNWAYGVWGQFAGNGEWQEVNSHIKPQSLYYALRAQRGIKDTLGFELYPLDSEPSSSPTQEQAAALTELASAPSLDLEYFIDKANLRNTISTFHENTRIFKKTKDNASVAKLEQKTNVILIKNGKLQGNYGLITGKTNSVPWWRGSLRPRDVKNAQPHITRFVPGHQGLGYTDHLPQTVASMKSNNIAAIDHNYGLWYERRMDDHERVRRYDADTWAPFYEQPFDRSGQFEAWDALSKYDLTSFNTWYWYRLQRFAKLAERENKILLNEQYFQHNILEAGAHWASSPWRSANNINNTPFPEPPPYAGDKRIFMSKQFYDVTNEGLAKLHRGFMIKNLENFSNSSNVLQLLSQEYTGPLHFMEFWLDVIQDFEKTNVNQSKITLSATKDVQDAILKKSEYASLIDVIDIKYWYYKQDGTLYAPEGGKYLAPRQHARKMDTGKETTSQTFRAIQEYRNKYPDKAVLYNTNAAPRMGWAVLLAGGSLPAIPQVEISGFQQAIGTMSVQSSYNDAVWEMSTPGKNYLFYFNEATTSELDLTKFSGNYKGFWVDENSGKCLTEHNFKGGEIHIISSDSKASKVLYIYKV